MTDPPLTPVECGTGILLDVLETHAEIPHIQEAEGRGMGSEFAMASYARGRRAVYTLPGVLPYFLLPALICIFLP